MSLPVLDEVRSTDPLVNPQVRPEDAVGVSPTTSEYGPMVAKLKRSWTVVPAVVLRLVNAGVMEKPTWLMKFAPASVSDRMEPELATWIQSLLPVLVLEHPVAKPMVEPPVSPTTL